MAAEIGGIDGRFHAYLAGGKKMSCFGDRCKYCFLQQYCQDLIELREKKILLSKDTPICLANLKSKKTIKTYHLNAKSNINTFTNFYIENRYFVKSNRCETCLKNKTCDGAHIELIRKDGFKQLVPFLKVIK